MIGQIRIKLKLYDILLLTIEVSKKVTLVLRREHVKLYYTFIEESVITFSCSTRFHCQPNIVLQSVWMSKSINFFIQIMKQTFIYYSVHS